MNKDEHLMAMKELLSKYREEPMDHSLPLLEFIEKYRHRFKPLRKLKFGARHKAARNSSQDKPLRKLKSK